MFVDLPLILINTIIPIIIESAGTLFRSNSMVSKMFKFYSRLIGLPYLYETIGPEISELIEEELGLEVRYLFLSRYPSS